MPVPPTDDAASDGPVIVVGAGPAGLMAAEQLAAHGLPAALYDAMPSPGRKFLMAGRGGLNLTHSEPFQHFLSRYGEAAASLAPMLEAFPPEALRAWAHDLGIETFVGSSGRVFPIGLKASPLLRAWLARLGRSGVGLRPRQRWIGFGPDGTHRFLDADGRHHLVRASAAVLALGGASWARLGADGAWAATFPVQDLAPFRPANCGFRIAWPDGFADRHAGTPLKNIALSIGDRRVRGEAVVSAYGIEGGAVYALGAAPHRALAQDGTVTFALDLKPDLSVADLAARLARPRRGASLASFLRKAANLPPIAAALLRACRPEVLDEAPEGWPERCANTLKALPLVAHGTAPIDRAISTAGGLRWAAVDEDLQLAGRPGVFVAGEMLDWEAPTGGYLLQACFATGRWAGEAAARYLAGVG
ncbi:NAD(FAD)-utilizing dehydrogenase [Aliidongia dinghuensis]|uniref:NAD(FAD)-utilizing dehydrogenase n=1 Tax=Aliidongia dinghuensis TaxID=1867774 RepID=A0A8J2YQD8_9PROT|nr:TIGR03862 family flavoprotein [Aliidongia dinghuensis]GGF08116.1 NAD(FAD)-utilizing dehydrogenase [Aliidongia dinghuensis]